MLDLGAETARADVDPAPLARDQHPAPMGIGVEATVGPPLGVAHIMPKARALATQVALAGHSSSLAPLVSYYHSCRSRTNEHTRSLTVARPAQDVLAAYPPVQGMLFICIVGRSDCVETGL